MNEQIDRATEDSSGSEIVRLRRATQIDTIACQFSQTPESTRALTIYSIVSSALYCGQLQAGLRNICPPVVYPVTYESVTTTIQ